MEGSRVGNAPWQLYDTGRCIRCGVCVPPADVLRDTHVCDAYDLLAHEAKRVAEQIELMHFEIDEYLRSSGGRRKSRFAQWCREHGR